MVTSGPAKAVGLTDRGTLARGLRADLVRFSAVGTTPVVKAVWRRGTRIA